MNDRKDFSRFSTTVEMPDLLDVQVKHYNWFLQQNTPSRERKNQGLLAVFNSLFPVQDSKGRYKLEFEEYSVGVPRYTIQECAERGLTYASPLKGVLSLSSYEVTKESKKFIEKITNECYLGDFPIMTPSGSFIINGAERVVVNQLQRSPGVIFGESLNTKGRTLYTSRFEKCIMFFP